MITLYPYQQKAVQDLIDSIKSGNRRNVLCMPTGAGKTVTFVSMVAKAIQKGNRAMILCDRKELIGQAKDKINDLGLAPTIIAPRHKFEHNNCYLASVDTLRRREIPDIDLLIIDEAHKQSFDKTILRYIEQYNPYIVGATATPVRTGAQKSMHHIYDNIVMGPSIPDLIDQGFLVPAKTFAAKEDFSSLEMRGGDFDIGQMFNQFNKTKMYDGVLDNYLRFSPDKKAICFNVNVEHSKRMTAQFIAAGISSRHLDGKTPDWERREILQEFKEGKFKVLNNCSVLTTGFDEPSIETVIVNRATMSMPLWLQMTGRGSRTHKGKDGFTIIDQGANVYRHGLWEEEREFNLVKPRRKKNGVAPVKACPLCWEINAASTYVCKACGHEWEKPKQVLAKAEFIEVNKLNNRGFGKNQEDISKMNMKELQEYGKLKGYKAGWAWMQMELRRKKGRK